MGEAVTKSIAIIGTLDTKGDQLEYLMNLIEGQGHQVIMIDVGVLGDVAFKPTIGREEVAKASGSSLEEIIALMDECKAMDNMALGASKLVKDLYSDSKLSGVLAVGGSVGTALALEVMKALPIGIPKLILSTVAYLPAITPDMVDSDIMMLPWVAGLWGLNSMSRQVLETAAGAISGAAKTYAHKEVSKKKVVGVTSLGQTVCRYMVQLKPALEERGYEVAVFHPTGMGGRLLEKAISDGSIFAVLDLCVGAELLNEVTGGVASAGKHRLEAAAQAGIPQIVSPGTMQVFHWGEDRPLPSKYKDRPQRFHSRLLKVVIGSTEEKAAVGEFMAEKLNMATGPVALVIPMKAFQHAHSPEKASGPEELDPFYKSFMSPEKGLEAFRKALVENLKSHVNVVTLADASLNDPAYVDTILSLFDEMVKRVS
jgi:uncharacterized protein (UPF0261 family)